MSSYQRLTAHPETGKAEKAEWLDDYFGHYNYGVRFPSDGKVFRADEYDWQENPKTMVDEGTHRGGVVTFEQTEKGSRFDHPMHEVEEKDGKRVITTKHEGGRQDVTVEVKRLDLKDPSKEDVEAGEKIAERLSKVAVRVVVIHKPTNAFSSFECKLPEVRSAAMQVVKKYNESLEERTGVKGVEAPLSEFVVVEFESHQVRVTKLV